MKPASSFLEKISSLPSRSQRQGRSQQSPKRAFTLLQILLVMAIIAVLSAFLFGAFGQSRGAAQRAHCDIQLKAITMALDAFRQDNGHYPKNLGELVTKKYLTDTSMLVCPADPRPRGSYNDYYILRSARDSGELPILVCPLCETDSGQAIQGFKGRYTKHFATRPAELTAAASTTIERPGKNPISGRIGMQLRGGDIIRTAAGGQAIIRFADGSESQMAGGSEITVLQSFISGHARAPLYTLIRQTVGDVHYRVNHGSKFDVSTPTATAGALGTAFQIKADTSNSWWLRVTESQVYYANAESRTIVTPSRNLAASSQSLSSRGDNTPLDATDSWVYIGTEPSSTINPTPTPTPTPTRAPTPTPTPRHKHPGHGNDDDEDGD